MSGQIDCSLLAVAWICNRVLGKELSMGNRRDHTNGTLERLNDALSALEGRMGLQRQQLEPRDDFAAIRARQAALEAPYARQAQARPHQPAASHQDFSKQSAMNLDSELRELRAELKREMSNSVSSGMQAMRNDLMSMQGSGQQPSAAVGNSGTRELRADIDALRSSVSQLAREESVQGLVDRWGVVEREIADLPKTLGTREELLAVSDRLDNVQHAILSLPQDQRLDGIEDQVRTLAMALEQIAGQGAPSHLPIENLEAKLDGLGRAIAAIPTESDEPAIDPSALERIEARISAVSRMLENDQASSTAAKMDDHFASLAARLNMIQEETANLRSHAATAYPHEAFARIEERIENVVGQIEQVASPQAIPAFDAQFAAINDRLLDLQNDTASLRDQGSSGIPSDVIDALGARIEQLGATIGNREDASSPSNVDDVLSELNDRLVYIIDKVNAQSDVAQETAQSLITSLDTRMEEIARRIDENESQSVAVPSLETLESRVEDIAQMLASGGGSSDQASAVDLSSLESQIAELTQNLSGSSAPIDEANLMSAARAAADEAIERLGANSSEPLAADLSNLTQDLKVLETLARDSDDRNSRTFEAIHDTLLKVVDHLSNLGEHINSTSFGSAEMPAAPSIAAAPAMPMARMEVPDAPTMAPFEEAPVAPVLDDREIGSEESVPPVPRAKLSPAQAAAAAAQAAIKDSGTVRPRTDIALAGDDKEAGSKSILKGMAKRLRGEAPAAIKAIADEPMVGEAQDDPMAPSITVEDDATVFDEPIEPGAGGADLGEIMRRVREERAGGPAASAAPMTDKKAVEVPAAEKDDSGKSDFIAAARRAAQAAAADATVVNRKDDGKKSKGMSSLGSILASRRKPILMGAGAILLALLALPLVRGYLAPAENTSQVQLEQTGEATENAVAAVDPEIGAPVEEFVTPVEPELAEDTNLAPEIAQPVAPELEIDPVETSAAGPEFVINIDDIPLDVGPIALREAAASGDAKALYIVGDYFTGGVPSQSGNDLSTALSWYEKSAELGYAPAQYRVGSFYEKGMGGDRDFDAAKTWYQLSAEQGNAAAMHNLAVLFANGVDGTPDMASATRWFQKAAELGLKDSQFNLGILAAKGDGMPQNLEESYKWFAIAAKTGDPDAAAKRDEVAEALSPEQLELARGTADLWKVKQIDEEANIVSVPDGWLADQGTTSSITPAEAAPAIDAAQMKKAVQNIQAILNNNGYDAGPTDGVMGGKTTTAIKSFQEANGLEPNGVVNQALVTKLIELNEKNNQG